MPAVLAVPAFPGVPAVPPVPAVPNVPDLWKISNVFIYSIQIFTSTSADKLFCIWKGKKRNSISALANLTNKWIHKGESYCKLHNLHDVATTLLNHAVFCALVQILKKTRRRSAGFGGRSVVCYTSKEPNLIIVPVRRKHWLENISVSIRLYRK